MKNANLIFILFFTISLTIIFNHQAKGQAPQAFNYQTIIRNGSGEVLANQAVSLRISIIQDSETGTSVYTETWAKTSNAFGLVTLNIGEGSSTEDFSTIDWGSNVYYLKVEIDPAGGNDYADAGASRLLSVPYALYAGSTAGTNTWSQNGSSVYYNAGNVGIGTDTPNKKLVIKATSDTDTLMEILDKNGNPLMVITPQLTKFNIIKDAANTSITSGGFAVGRYALAKDGKASEDNNLFLVTPDSTRIYTIGQETAGASGTSGGFAVGRYALAKDGKGEAKYNFYTDGDSTKIIIPNDPAGTRIGGFAVQEDNINKGIKENKFDVSTRTTSELINGKNRVLWYPEKNAFMAGRLLVEHADSVGENSLAIGYECQAKGDYSTAIGYNAVAKNASSFAFGQDAQALNVESYAFGRESQAIGLRSFAFGSGCPGGISNAFAWDETVAPKAIGDYSFAFGLGSEATGFGSFTLGYNNIASAHFSTALGFKTSANGEASTALGYETTANGYACTALGIRTNASGSGSTAMGVETSASGAESTAIGIETSASGEGSLALGISASASGAESMTIGKETKASGNNSMAIGIKTTASGNRSTAMGTLINTRGVSSFGIGLYDWNATHIDTIIQSNTMAIMGGNVGIGTVSPDKKLEVNGDIRVVGNIIYGQGKDKYSKPDFVFDDNYQKKYGILETEQFIIKNKHLPWLTASKEEKDGINLTRMHFETLEAVENQQMQIISLKKQVNMQAAENRILKNKVNTQTGEIQSLKQEIEALKKLIRQ